jgi:3-oxoacyl-[acyl-carrier protein] reductase
MRPSYVVSGAGSGIGKAICIELAAALPEVGLILVGRDARKLSETIASLENPSFHRAIACDIRDHVALREGLSRLTEFDIQGVVANAGIGGENEYGENDRWDEILSTNLTGTYRLILEAMSRIQQSKAKNRSIVIISSILARIGVPHYSAYCASKAVELAPERIRVNAVCPGWVRTEMATQGLDLMAERSGKNREVIEAEQMGYVPLGKMSDPKEVASLVRFLVDGAQTSITGQVLDINNGAFMA